MSAEASYGLVQIYPGIEEQVVFNVCSTKYRFILKVSYANQWTNGTLFVKHLLTHAEYNKDRWKKDCCT